LEHPIPTPYEYSYRWTRGIAAISVGLLSWVFWRAGLAEVWRSLRSADFGLIAVVIPVILAGLAFKAIRWRVLLLPLGTPSIAVSFSSMMLGYLGNNLLPMRAGEALRAYALGQQTSISKSAVLATIVVERVVDGVLMILVLSLLFLFFPVPNWLRLTSFGAGLMIAGVTVGLIIARKTPQRAVKMFRAILDRMPAPWRQKGISLLENFLMGLSSFRSSTDALFFLLLTLTVWSAEVFWFWLALHAFGVSLPVLAATLLVAAGAVSTMIPASPGYVGTYEFVLVNVLTVMGVLVGPATACALGIHGLAWLTVNVVGAVCTLTFGLTLKPTYSI